MSSPWKPTKEQLLAAIEKKVPDVIAPDLRVLFSGINPGLYTAAVGHHFARPGNRFWPALHAGGFTDRVLSAFEERELLKSGYGITNVVPRATATADLLTKDEIVAGGEKLRRKGAPLSAESAGFAGSRSLSHGIQSTESRCGPSSRDDWRKRSVGFAEP